MAGDWIKMRCDLHTHPKVVRIASALNADRLRVIGALHAVWGVFDAHSIDGHLPGYSMDAMDAVIGWPGFCRAMQGIDWIATDGDCGLQMPEFTEHNGASAKRRAQEGARKRRDREAANPVRKVSASDADKKRTREEKRREEGKPTSDAKASSVLIFPSVDVSTPTENRLSVTNGVSVTGATWEAYREAYLMRYNAEPVRNATTNGQMANFVKRIGAVEAPQVAVFYVTSNQRYYVQNRHSVGALLKDAESLRTQWATNTRVTETEARQADRTQATGQVFNNLIEEFHGAK